MRLIITQEQYNKGWLEYIRDGIPNLVRHHYENPQRLPDGNVEVDAPPNGNELSRRRIERDIKRAEEAQRWKDEHCTI